MSNITLYVLVAATILVALFGRHWQQKKNISEWKALSVMIGILVLINVIMFGLEWLFSR